MCQLIKDTTTLNGEVEILPNYRDEDGCTLRLGAEKRCQLSNVDKQNFILIRIMRLDLVKDNSGELNKKVYNRCKITKAYENITLR